MLIGNRFVKIIFMTFGWIVLLLLVVHWAIPEYGVNTGDFNFQNRLDTFKGFKWFFEQMGKFPGLEPTIQGMKDWVGILQFANYDPTNIWNATGITYVVGALKIMVTPFVALGLIVYNIALLLIWILGFFVFW